MDWSGYQAARIRNMELPTVADIVMAYLSSKGGCVRREALTHEVSCKTGIPKDEVSANISNTINYLVRHGKVVRAGHGFYMAAP